MQTRLWVERLEIRTLLTSLSLVPHPIKAEVSGRLTLNDINDDSRADFLTIEDDRIAIYESTLTPDGGIELSQQPCMPADVPPQQLLGVILLVHLLLEETCISIFL